MKDYDRNIKNPLRKGSFLLKNFYGESEALIKCFEKEREQVKDDDNVGDLMYWPLTSLLEVPIPRNPR